MTATPEIPLRVNSANASDLPEAHPETPSDPAPDEAATRSPKGKIASLTKPQRDTINSILLNGGTYAVVIRTMAEQGISLNHENISNWHNGPGYQLWLKDQEWRQDIQADQECGLDVLPGFDADKFNEAALQVAIIQVFRAFRHLGSTPMKAQLGGDPQSFARLVNALARACRETLNLQKYRHATLESEQAAALSRLRPEPEVGLTPENLRKLEKKLKLR